MMNIVYNKAKRSTVRKVRKKMHRFAILLPKPNRELVPQHDQNNGAQKRVRK